MKPTFRIFFLFFLGILVFACTPHKEKTIEFKTLSATSISINTIKEHKLNALVFLAPGCPLSEAALFELRKLDSLYAGHDYKTYIVIPGNLYTMQEIETFKNSFDIQFPILIDSNYYLTNLLKATITPEYFLLAENMIVLYQGAIDDRALDNDVVRQAAKLNYASLAIECIINKNKINTPKTNAVGCYIER